MMRTVPNEIPIIILIYFWIDYVGICDVRRVTKKIFITRFVSNSISVFFLKMKIHRRDNCAGLRDL